MPFRIEKLTIWTSINTYGDTTFGDLSALDHLIPVLTKHLDPECVILDYDAEDWTPRPVHSRDNLNSEEGKEE